MNQLARYSLILEKCCQTVATRAVQHPKLLAITEFSVLHPLFPLDRSGGLGGYIVADAVDALDLGDDTAGDLIEHGVFDRLDLGGHSVDGIDGADDYGIFKAANTVSYANRASIRNESEILPYFA